AERQPVQAVALPFEESQHRFLMVAHQVDLGEARHRIVEQALDHAPALRATIDVVAEKHQLARLVGRMAPGIVGNAGEQVLEQIEAPVDVADGIYRLPGRHCPRPDLGAPPEQASQHCWPLSGAGAYFTRGTMRFNLAIPVSSAGGLAARALCAL